MRSRLDILFLVAALVVIAAFGTVDVFHGRSDSEIVDAYLDLVAAAPGVTMLIATTPPLLIATDDPVATATLAQENAQIATLNQAIRTTFPGRVVDFDAGFADSAYYKLSDVPPFYGGDGVHLTELGQILREERAYHLLVEGP